VTSRVHNVLVGLAVLMVIGAGVGVGIALSAGVAWVAIVAGAAGVAVSLTPLVLKLRTLRRIERDGERAHITVIVSGADTIALDLDDPGAAAHYLEAFASRWTFDFPPERIVRFRSQGARRGPETEPERDPG
jgi:hypothetical protein